VLQLQSAATPGLLKSGSEGFKKQVGQPQIKYIRQKGVWKRQLNYLSDKSQKSQLVCLTTGSKKQCRKRIRLSRSTSDSCKTDSAGIKQPHEESKESRQAQPEDRKDKPVVMQSAADKDMKADTSLEPEFSAKEKKYENIAEDDAEPLTNDSVSSAAQLTTMAEEDHTQDDLRHETEEKDNELKDKPAVTQSAGDNEQTVGSEHDAEQLTGTDVSAELVCNAELKTDQLQQETVEVDTELESLQSNPDLFVVLSDTDSENSTQSITDDAAKEVEKVQSLNNTSCTEATTAIPGTIEQLDQSATCDENGDSGTMSGMQSAQSGDKKHTVQSRQQLKPRRRNRDGISVHSEQLEKGKKNVERDSKGSRKRSDNVRRHQLYTQDVNRSRRDAKKGFAEHDSKKHEKHTSVKRHYYYEPYGVMRHEDHSGRYLKQSNIRRGFADLEDISDDDQNVEYEDGGDHCCPVCHETFKTIPGLLEHLQSAPHEQVFIFYVSASISYLAFDW